MKPCVEWAGSLNKDGYGLTHHYFDGKRRTVLAHRLTFFQAHGWWPPAVLHRCDNPPCQELSHLMAGTVLDNNADMVAKGRQAKGEKVNTAKLTADQVIEIRRLWATGTVLQRELAEQFNISLSHIGNLVRPRGGYWK